MDFSRVVFCAEAAVVPCVIVGPWTPLPMRSLASVAMRGYFTFQPGRAVHRTWGLCAEAPGNSMNSEFAHHVSCASTNVVASTAKRRRRLCNRPVCADARNGEGIRGVENLPDKSFLDAEYASEAESGLASASTDVEETEIDSLRSHLDMEECRIHIDSLWSQLDEKEREIQEEKEQISQLCKSIEKNKAEKKRLGVCCYEIDVFHLEDIEVDHKAIAEIVVQPVVKKHKRSPGQPVCKEPVGRKQKEYKGWIAWFRGGSHGHIYCEETYKVYKCDVFFRSEDCEGKIRNTPKDKSKQTWWQWVSFELTINDRQKPQAVRVTVHWKFDE